MNKKISGADILKEGLAILNSVALKGGAYISHGRDTRFLPTYRDAYFEVIGAIANLMDMEEILKFSPEEMGDELLKGLRSHLSLDDLRSLSYLSIFDQESYSELIQRYNVEVSLNDGVQLNSVDINSVACRGYELLRPNTKGSRSIYRIMWGLVLIGISSLFFRRTTKCKFCPRRSRVGGKYCSEHSQSDPSNYGLTHSNQYMRYRAGKKTYLLSFRLNVQWICPIAVESPPDELTHVMFMSEILTSSYHEFFPDYRSVLMFALERAPNVASFLGGDQVLETLDYPSLVRLIKVKLNPYYSNEGTLTYALHDFDIWLKLENQVLRGIRGLGDRNFGKIEMAISMAENGERQIDIARKLGVARSSVSGWLARYTVKNLPS